MRKLSPFLISCALAAGGCVRDPDPVAAAGPGLTVFAAASTTDVVSRLAAGFDGARVATSFGGSSGLARQIRDGAPADVYISASRRWVEYLDGEGVLIEAPRVFCFNRMVCIAPAGSALASAPPANAGQLAALLAQDERVALADEGVPAGEYARQSLVATGHLEALRGRLVGQDDVRSVLRAVVSGEAAAGFVYATDARVAEVELLFEVDPTTCERIEYFAALPADRPNTRAARAFLEHLASDEARAILEAAGFQVPEP